MILKKTLLLDFHADLLDTGQVALQVDKRIILDIVRLGPFLRELLALERLRPLLPVARGVLCA